jgi:hypothetical protein
MKNSMTALTPTSTRSRRARTSLLAALATFVAFQLGLSVVMDHWLPVLHDAEYGRKLALLKARQAEHPGRSLTLVLGSSRSGLGIDPESLSPVPDGSDTLLFNFAITGCGPIQELQMLKRLLRQGVRPDRLVIEVHPLMLHQENGIGEECWIEARRMDWRDLMLVSDYVVDRRGLIWRWCRCRVAPWYSNRFLIMNCIARNWLDRKTQFDPWTGLTGYGWLPFRQETVSRDEYQRGVDSARQEYAPLFAGYRITEQADRAMQTLLALCRDEAIPTALFVMPEGSEFRGWYSASARRRFDEYLAQISGRWNIAVHDATEWSDDGEFADSHHLLMGGARRFSRRFGRDVVADFVSRPRARLAARPAD